MTSTTNTDFFYTPLLTESDIDVRRRVALGVRVVLNLLLLLVFVAALPDMDRVFRAWPDKVGAVLLFIVCYAPFGWIAALGLHHYLAQFEALRLMRYAPISESEAMELVTVCNATPGLHFHRDRVLGLGRQFTVAEHEAMVAWACEAACRP